MRTLSVGSLLLILPLCAAQSIFVHWDKARDGFVRPQLNGIDKPANSPFAIEADENKTTALDHWQVSSDLFQSSVYNGTFNLSEAPQLQEATLKNLKSICSAENISCTSCYNRHHYQESILKHIENLSIRSLKNFLAIRGLRCLECKSKADLQRIAVYGAHLPHRKFVLPAVMIPNCFLFPRGTLKISVIESKFQFMLRLIEKGERRFALLPTTTIGIIARITKIQHSAEGEVQIHIVGEQRFHADGAIWTAAGHFAQDVTVINGTLFTDSPVSAADAVDLRTIDKSARRAFFWLDSDRWAARRAQSLLGSPPPESDGPEALSHWLGMALTEPRLQAEMFVTNSTRARLAMARVALDLFRGGLPPAAGENRTGFSGVFDGERLRRLGASPTEAEPGSKSTAAPAKKNAAFEKDGAAFAESKTAPTASKKASKQSEQESKEQTKQKIKQESKPAGKQTGKSATRKVEEATPSAPRSSRTAASKPAASSRTDDSKASGVKASSGKAAPSASGAKATAAASVKEPSSATAALGGKTEEIRSKSARGKVEASKAPAEASKAPATAGSSSTRSKADGSKKAAAGEPGSRHKEASKETPAMAGGKAAAAAAAAAASAAAAKEREELGKRGREESPAAAQGRGKRDWRGAKASVL